MRASEINLLRSKREDQKTALASLLRLCLTKSFFIAFPRFDTEKRQICHGKDMGRFDMEMGKICYGKETGICEMEKRPRDLKRDRKI